MGNTNLTLSSHFKRRKFLFSNTEQIFDDVIIVCLNSIDDNQSIANEFNQIMYSIKIFFDENSCKEYLDTCHLNDDKQIFLIVNEIFGEKFIFQIHDFINIDSIYFYSKNNIQNEYWSKNYFKLKGNLFSNISKLAEKLHEDILNYQNNFIRFHLTKNQLNKLDANFMYSHLLKEILVHIQYKQNAKEHFRSSLSKQINQLEILNEFVQNYERYPPIWWYTRESFIYHILNKALRTENIDLLIDMGFYIRDLHQQIVDLYHKQEHLLMIVYRGQGLTIKQFETLNQCKGGLISFQQFLSTTLDKQISLQFARHAIEKPGIRGILFQMTIDPKLNHSSHPYANITQLSYYQNREKEILFSSHSVFRIEHIEKIHHEKNLWQVYLRLTTNEEDIQLENLRKHFREELQLTKQPYESLAKLLLYMGCTNKAEEIYRNILNDISIDDQQQLAYIYHQLGYVYNEKAQFDQALEYFQKSLEIKKNLLENDLDKTYLAETYVNIGSIYHSRNDLQNAFAYFNSALETNTTNERILASIYHNIGMIHRKQQDFNQALTYFNQTLEIDLKTLPTNHPDLAKTYSNMGKVYLSLDDYLNASIYFKKTLDIRTLSLPKGHPALLLALANYQQLQSFISNSSNQNHQQKQRFSLSRRLIKKKH